MSRTLCFLLLALLTFTISESKVFEKEVKSDQDYETSETESVRNWRLKEDIAPILVFRDDPMNTDDGVRLIRARRGWFDNHHHDYHDYGGHHGHYYYHGHW